MSLELYMDKRTVVETKAQIHTFSNKYFIIDFSILKVLHVWNRTTARYEVIRMKH